MIDLFGVLEKIVKLATDIKKAVKDADLNMEYCHMMDNLVDTVRTVVGEDQNFTEEEGNALRVTMNRLQVALKKACERIHNCREQDKNIFRRASKAADTAKELQQIHIEISSCISTLQLAKSYRQHTSLRNIEQTQGLILQLLLVRLDNVPQEQEVTGSVQTLGISDSTDIFATRSGNESKRSKPKVFAPGKEPADFLAAAGLEKYSLRELREATASFKQETIVGEGAGGSVYRGKLKQEEVAIKDHNMFLDFDSDVKGLVEEFKLLSTLEHKNIIKLLGCHVPKVKSAMRKYNNDFPQKEAEKRFLSVTKYMPKGSLASIIIEDNNKKNQIGWASLVHIIQGIAEGILYLHQNEVVHLDLKPSHILIDSDMTPKINDFRTARMLKNNVDSITLENLPASSLFAYTAPEQFSSMRGEGIASTKSDVFSFGVIIIAILTCMCKSQDHCSALSDPDPKEWLIRVEHNDWMDIFDETRVIDKFERTMATWLLTIGLMCCVPNPADRPSMLEVVNMLLAARETKPWHEILTQDDLRTLMHQDSAKIAEALTVPFGVAERLLLCSNWTLETVTKKWSLNRKAASRGIGLRSTHDRAMKLDERFSICELCRNELCNNRSTGSCDHYYCQSCWREYIGSEVNGLGPLCLYLQCPHEDCSAPVVREIFELMAGARDMEWYNKHALDSYVLNRGMIRSCPGPDCDHAINFHGCVGNVGVDVVCDSKHSSHWRCHQKAHHQPEKQCQMEVDEFNY